MERLKLKSLCFSEVWFSLISLFSTFAFFLFSLSAHQCPSFASWQGSAVLEFIKLGHSIFHHSLNNLSVSLTSHSQRENLTESQAPDLVPFIRGSSLGWGYQYDCVRCGRGRSLWQKVYVWRLWIASVVGYYLKEHFSDVNVLNESPENLVKIRVSCSRSGWFRMSNKHQMMLKLWSEDHT